MGSVLSNTFVLCTALVRIYLPPNVGHSVKDDCDKILTNVTRLSRLVRQEVGYNIRDEFDNKMVFILDKFFFVFTLCSNKMLSEL